jgi:transcriptional regulator with XRE-family HTH domain
MNRGAEKLQKSLPNEHGAKAELAREVGVKPYQVSHWLAGRRKPNFTERAFLEDKKGIGWRLWDEPVSASARRRRVA